MLDDLRNYLQMASGITEATTAKAREVVTGLLSAGMSLTSKAVPAPDMVGQVQDLADDLVATSKNNRELLVGLIRSEVDRAVGRMGFVREDELAALRRHVQRLERELADVQSATNAAGRTSEPVDDVVAVEEVVAVDVPVEEVVGVDEVTGEFGDVPVKRKKKILLEDGNPTDA